MRKLVIAAIATLLLAGCSSSESDVARDYCQDLVTKNVEGTDLDMSKLAVESVSDALFDSGITNERDHSTTHYAVSGSVTHMEGSTEIRQTVICQVVVAEGRVSRLIDFTIA